MDLYEFLSLFNGFLCFQIRFEANRSIFNDSAGRVTCVRRLAADEMCRVTCVRRLALGDLWQMAWAPVRVT